MKKQLMVFVVAVLLTASCDVSQPRTIPAEVAEAFKVRYHDAKNVSWSDKITTFQASFDQYETKYRVSFNSKGEWKKTERDLSLDYLPDIVNLEMMNNKYAGWTLKTVTRIEAEENEEIQWRLFMEDSALKKKYVYLH